MHFNGRTPLEKPKMVEFPSKLPVSASEYVQKIYSMFVFGSFWQNGLLLDICLLRRGRLLDIASCAMDWIIRPLGCQT
jgi:hypothetical protein